MTKRTRMILQLLLAAFASTLSLAVHAELAYRIEMIELPPGGNAWDLNNKGEVIGTLHSFNVSSPVLWRKGKLINLTRAMSRGGGDSIFTGSINDHSVILGSDSDGSFLFKRPHRRVDLPPLAVAEGLNNRNEVFGTWFGDPNAPAFIWHKGQLKVLQGLPGSTSNAAGMNDRGDVVGVSGTEPVFAVVWSGDEIMPLPILPGTVSGQGNAINNLGQVVGVGIRSDLKLKGFLWTDGTLIELPGPDPQCLESFPVAINDWGVVIGSAYGCARGDVVAMVWIAAQPIALDDLIATNDPLREQLRMRTTIAINDRGQIVSIATDRATGLQKHFVLLTPTRRPGALR
jgi:probable HAF family extracellular repeat protein